MLATFDRRLCAANRWCVNVMLAAMASMVFTNVALRFFTDRSILWVEEVSRYTMIWLTFIGAGLRYAIRTWAQTTPVMEIPVGAVYLAMPIGFALMFVHLLLMATCYLRRGGFLAGGEFDADAARL